MSHTPPTPSPFLRPNWPAPPQVQALCSGRAGGVSLDGANGAYASLNLGDHVGDAPEAVAANRRIFGQALAGAQAHFLEQVHGIEAIALPTVASGPTLCADASYSRQPMQACTVMVADCLPVLFCNRSGTQVAAAHAGWRGLCDGVLEATVATFAPDDALLAWLGPCIGPQAFEVGAEVKAAFVARHAWAGAFFAAQDGAKGKFLCDLAGLARQLLQGLGVAAYGNDGGDFWCTYTQADVWFSHRRESQQGRQAGRQAAAVWLCR